MSLLSKIADRLILCPSTNRIDLGENRRELIYNDGKIEIEAWVSQFGDVANASEENRLVVLKIGGTGGRAERATVHPAELIVDADHDGRFDAAEVWTLNHRGYGGSSAPASLANFTSTLEAFWSHIENLYPIETKLVTGNSLGCISALYLARRKTVGGLQLRNPPPLHQMIRTRPKYNWWSFGASKHFANQVPDELDSIENAKHINCPALFVTSEKDSVVPPEYQQQIIDSFAGETRQFVIEGAEHHNLVPDHQRSDYVLAVDWLKKSLKANSST